jgi:hypothetical protein
VPADTVVLAAGAQADTTLADELKDSLKEVYAIGDCDTPSYAKEAINAGAEVGRKI